MAHGIADAAGGATASMCSQVLGVPVDIISQRQMAGVAVRAASGRNRAFKGLPQRRSRPEGDHRGGRGPGLYRGFGASIATLVPGSAIWWGFYGTYQRVFWQLVPAELGGARVRDEGLNLATASKKGPALDKEDPSMEFKAAVARDGRVEREERDRGAGGARRGAP